MRANMPTLLLSHILGKTRLPPKEVYIGSIREEKCRQGRHDTHSVNPCEKGTVLRLPHLDVDKTMHQKRTSFPARERFANQLILQCLKECSSALSSQGGGSEMLES